MNLQVAYRSKANIQNITVIQQMFFGKYKILRNNGLLPKIDPVKPESILTCYCMISDKNQPYSIQRNPSDKNMLILFNEKEYMHRKCSFITNHTNPTDALTQMGTLYPKDSHTLTIFVANNPQQCDRMLLGSSTHSSKGKQAANSLIDRAYKHMVSSKSEESSIQLSIIGIQNENSLTDELSFEWLDTQDFQEETPLKSIVKHKPKVKIIKDSQSHRFVTQNLSQVKIQSAYKLTEILQKYKEVKSHLQNWIISTEYTEYYLQGELYHLKQTKPSQSSDQARITIQSHYILRVNQYIRTTSPLMLRLGINLRRIQDEHGRTMEMHQSRLFKLLSECFTSKSSKNRQYHYHLFFQVGEYSTLKEQYLCLVPTSLQHKMQTSNLSSIIQSQFFYTKQIMEYPELHSMITNLISSQKSTKANQSFLPQISGLLKARLKTKSYVCDTYSSQEKRINKYRHLATEENYDRSQMDLEELVNEAAKIYRIPTPKKNFKQNLSQFKKRPRRDIRASLFEKSVDSAHKEKDTHFEKRRKEASIENSDKDLQNSKFYENTKEWLGLIYGKNSSKKLQSNKRMHKFDQTTNVLIREMLSKEIAYPEKEEIDQAIDHF